MKNLPINTSFSITGKTDLLEIEAIKDKLIAAYRGIENYEMAKKDGFYMAFEVYTEDATVTINDGVASDLIANKLYSSNGAKSGIKKIEVNGAAQGVFSFCLGE